MSLVHQVLAQTARLLPARVQRTLLGHLPAVPGYSSFLGARGELPGPDALDFFFALGCSSDEVHTIVDAGANVGTMTRGFHLCYPRARIFAFEPNPDVYRQLREGLERDEPFASALRRGQIETINAGLYSTAGEMELHVLASADSSSFVPVTRERLAIHPELYAPVKTVSASLMTLDEFVANRGIDRIDLLKIDVEGVYREVLQGAPETLRRTSRVLIEIDWTVKGRESRDWIDAVEMLFDAGLYLTSIVNVVGNRARGLSIQGALDIWHRRVPPAMRTYVMDCAFERLSSDRQT